MAETTADVLIERLIDWGIDTIFGFPGDGVNGIFESLRTHQDKLRFIQVRHEEAAAFAAVGYAKYSGRLGVCLHSPWRGPHSGPKRRPGMPASDEHRSSANIARHSTDLYAPNEGIPSQAKLQEAADLINGSSKVAIMAGRGCLKARDEVLQLADKVAGPVIKPLLGKAVVPDNSPYTTGGIGLLGTAPSQEALKECELLIIAGSGMPYMEFYPKPGAASCVQIDYDPERIGLRYPADVGLIGDCGVVLRALLPLINHKRERSFLEHAQDGMKHWNKLMEIRGTRPDKPMKPHVVTHHLNKLLIGAVAAFPDRQVVCIVGDGGFTMLMGEVATLVKYRMPVKVIIIKNNTLGQIKWEQLVQGGTPGVWRRPAADRLRRPCSRLWSRGLFGGGSGADRSRAEQRTGRTRPGRRRVSGGRQRAAHAWTYYRRNGQDLRRGVSQRR
jgi:thiamine pyrophosphate-dependent acetolactate synthase large subunit-like protein